MHTRPQEIADWLRERVAAAGARGLAVGVGGDLPSAVVAGLCHLAMPGHVVAAVLPCHRDPREHEDAGLVAAHFGLRAVTVDLSPTYDQLTASLSSAMSRAPIEHPLPRDSEDPDPAGIAIASITPRLRMIALYFAATSLNYLVAGARNRCELIVGDFIKHGDGAADLFPIGDLLSSDVVGLARDLGVPQSVIDHAAGGGPWPGQAQEADVGFSYAQLERYLAGGPDAVPPAIALRIERLVRQAAHKRHLAPTPRSEAADRSFPADLPRGF